MTSEHLILLASRVGSSLGNHLWQSTLFAGIIAILTVLLRRNRSSLRFSLWAAASIKFLIPFSLFIGFGASLPKALPIAAAPYNSMYSAIENAGQPFDQLPPISLPHAGLMKANSALVLPTFFLGIWFSGIIVVFLVWSCRWRRISTLLRKSEPADSGREVEMLRELEHEAKRRRRIRLVRSQEMMEPGVFGIVRPFLLWPTQLTARLEDEHLRAILAHELMHVRRRDNLIAALHMLVEALFWFHPIVWWMESRIVQERECACDEDVVELIGQPEVYAEGILRACRFCLESPLVCVSGIAGADLRNRIFRITNNQRGARLNLVLKLILAVGALAVVVVPMSFGFMAASQSQSSLLHPTTSPLPAFEVATIKPNNDVKAGMRIELSPANFNAHGGSIQELVEFAYNVNSHDRLVGLPSEISSQRFDIRAKASESEIATIHNLPVMAQMTELRLMLQSLLADRFKLKVSFKTAELPVYALVVAKGGPKFKEVEVDPLPPPGTQPKPGANIPRLGKTGASQYSATAWDMGSTADFLSRFDEVGHRSVVDETGLKGHYNFVLDGISVGPSSDESAISIFTALEEQLGLKLVPRKAPLEVLVIDHVEQPSEN